MTWCAVLSEGMATANSNARTHNLCTSISLRTYYAMSGTGIAHAYAPTMPCPVPDCHLMSGTDIAYAAEFRSGEVRDEDSKEEVHAEIK
eukprot:1678959-Rhodomonas_salina.4